MIFYLKALPYIEGTRRISPKEHLKTGYAGREVSHSCIAQEPFGTGYWLYEITCLDVQTQTDILAGVQSGYV